MMRIAYLSSMQQTKKTTAGNSKGGDHGDKHRAR
jgi:hypothetical protein